MPQALSRVLSCSHLSCIPIKETNDNNKQQVSNLALLRQATSPKGSLSLMKFHFLAWQALGTTGLNTHPGRAQADGVKLGFIVIA